LEEIELIENSKKKNSMEVLEKLEKSLNRYINYTQVNENWGVYFIKEQIARIRNMKIEMYSNDHNPPHFHVKSNDNSINAVFSLHDCSFIKGDIKSKDKKKSRSIFFC
jgi:hypothetical protein